MKAKLAKKAVAARKLGGGKSDENAAKIGKLKAAVSPFPKKKGKKKFPALAGAKKKK